MLIKLENDWLQVEVSCDGAELRKVKHKKNNLDYMWSGDEDYWGRVSPVLFPIVGRLKEDQYELNGQIYKMSQHGFLRDVQFKVEDQTATYVSFSYESDGRFTDVYPYEFKAVIHYALEKDSLTVKWEIVNVNKETMYFALGAHPAFKVPLLENETMEDYRLQFTPAKNKNVVEYEVEHSLIHEKGPANDVAVIPLSHSLFIKDALIYSNIESIKLLSNKSAHSVEVLFEEFPFVGVWSKHVEEDDTMAPFVCIEPWHGIADMHDTNGNFMNKTGINKLDAGKTFQTEYQIKFQ